jgi:hypothetical protein
MTPSHKPKASGSRLFHQLLLEISEFETLVWWADRILQVSVSIMFAQTDNLTGAWSSGCPPFSKMPSA